MRLFSVFVLLVTTVSADAGSRGRRSAFESPRWMPQSSPTQWVQPATTTAYYAAPVPVALPAPIPTVVEAAAVEAAPVPSQVQPAPIPAQVQPAPIPAQVQSAAVQPSVTTVNGSDDALDEVNARRAARGLPAFIKDPGLTLAAAACAKVRAASFVDGHLGGPMGDFGYLPAGVSASAAGCGALEPSWGWGTCCMDDHYTYAGAAWVMGANGKRYMHLFVR